MYYEAGSPFEACFVTEESYHEIRVLRGVRDVHMSLLQQAAEENRVVFGRVAV